MTNLHDQAPAATMDFFIEGITHDIGAAFWFIEFNASAAELWNVWQLGVAGQSELGVTTVLGSE